MDLLPGLRRRQLADGVIGLDELKKLLAARNRYEGQIATDVALRIYSECVQRVEVGLAALGNQELVEQFYVRPHFENTQLPSDLLIGIRSAFVIMLTPDAPLVGDSEDAITLQVEATFRRIPELASPEALELLRQVGEVLMFDCKIPTTKPGTEFASPSRALWLLGEYWDLYRAVLLHHGTAGASESPHPLLRFMVEARTRMGALLEAQAEPMLTQALEAVFAMPLDLDTGDLWTEHGQPRADEAQSAYEEVRARCSVSGFRHTDEEALFFECARRCLEVYSKRISKALAQRFGPAPPRAGRAPEPEVPNTPEESLREVELALRRTIQRRFGRRFGARWLEQVKAAMEPLALAAAEARLQQEAASAGMDDFLHFAHLGDVLAICSGAWSVVQVGMTVDRRKFNALAETIKRGRTQVAHNRPPHLWPPIERQRLMVACHDMIQALGEV